MKAVITGATGLLGGNLALQLIDEGVDVVATRRRTSRVEHLDDAPITWVEAGLDDIERLARVFDEADVVFHCAADVSTARKPTPAMIATNVDGTRHVLEAAKAASVGRLIHCSTIATCAVSTDGEPVTEDKPWNLADLGLDDAYAVTKREAEQLVLEATRAGLDAVVVNPGYMFGPRDAKPSSGKLILDLIEGKIPGYTSGGNSFVDVRDVARGMIGAWRRGRQGERYLLAGHNLSYREMMYEIAEIAGVAPPRFGFPRFLGYGFGWLGELQEAVTGRQTSLNISRIRMAYSHFIFSSAKAERELGYHHGPLDVAFGDAIAWFRARGMMN